jgi:hypothetical protein
MGGHEARPIKARTGFSIARLGLSSLRCGTVSCTLARFYTSGSSSEVRPSMVREGAWWTMRHAMLHNPCPEQDTCVCWYP